MRLCSFVGTAVRTHHLEKRLGVMYVRTTSPLPQGNESGEQMDDGLSEAERGGELEESSE